LGLISYYDATNGNLKVAHCSDRACVPTNAIAEQLSIPELHLSKDGVTERLPVRMKKNGATAEKESLEVGSF